METPLDSLFDMIVKQHCFTHEMGQRMALATDAEKHEIQSQKMQRSKFNPCTWHRGILEMWHLHKEFLFLFLSPHQCLMKCYISSFLEHFSMLLFSCSESCPTFCNSMHFSILHLTLNKFLFKSQFYCYKYTYHTTPSFEGYNSMSFSYIYLIG